MFDTNIYIFKQKYEKIIVKTTDSQSPMGDFIYQIISTVLCIMIHADMLNLSHVIFYTGC